MKKKFKVFIILTLVVTLFIGVIPASAKTSKSTVKKTKAAAERLLKHAYWSGLIKETTLKKFDPDEPATYNFAARVIVNAYCNSDKKSISDFVYYGTEDAMATVRGSYFAIASKKSNKKKAGDILATFSDDMYEKFDGTEYVSKKWLFATMNAFKDNEATYDKEAATKVVQRSKDNWNSLYDLPGKGVLTKLDVVNIVYDTYVMQFIK